MVRGDIKPLIINEKEEYRIKVSVLLGIPLKKGWVIHHIDGDPTNNSKHNLALLFSNKAHARAHSNYRQAWFMSIYEATELGRFFERFARHYKLAKKHGENPFISWRNQFSEGQVKLHPFHEWYKKNQRWWLNKCDERYRRYHSGRYLSRKRVGDKWVYDYGDGSKNRGYLVKKYGVFGDDERTND
jgi:hypothetical protein